ncbi:MULTISPECIES: glutathione S-transferase family protein [unclassified Corallococcus]|uniref:glutathione S-transferase family protein n=1 Tax=unclassified Corallococcus TaxID=2685029 RepID=UPI001A8C7619|nr:MULTISPECIES: glutathione S-transferase N-terminal domain-containing protein [unclassified Corallococcus]MBN9688459.1 glutathione S-transferase N-terminal domain-containing protein [Corallococcus sp. NCSPR001]WAS87740.1 glutathione S-transferase N-terminal domain-containing protein [Corallococcus sp. NCRR]
MIDLYTFKTPNGRKVSIALEELGLPYKTHSVDIMKGEQFKPEYLAINPNNKIPAIVDHDAQGGPLTLFESGAILLYLAEKTGRLMPTDPRGKAEVTQWLMFQMSGLGPMLGQLNHFGRFANTKVPYAIDRFQTEAKRILGVVEQQVSSRDYLATTYSIADIATYPWLKGAREFFPELFVNLPNIIQYLHRVGSRPAVQRGMQIP